MPRSRLAVVSVLLCAATVACGGSDNKPSASPSASTTTPSPTPSAMTKAEYVVAVNNVCARVQTEGDAVAEPKTAQEYLTALNTLIGILDTAMAELRAMTPPAADAATLEAKFLTPNDQQAAVLKAALPDVTSAAAANDMDAAAKALGDAFVEFERIGEANAKFATDYGLTDCA